MVEVGFRLDDEIESDDEVFEGLNELFDVVRVLVRRLRKLLQLLDDLVCEFGQFALR